ncbi:MAG: HIT family protein [Bacteroidales bacterium]|jgi:histidine triad (HIT) family protein|nr:HIT family protein [Bacteroidales bacterium]
MASIFTKIIQGEIPAYKIAEDDKHLAFLDINPLAKGHALAIPKQEVDYVLNMEDAALADLMIFAKRVGLAIEKVVSCKRMGITVIGLEVPHTHIHLIPINTIYDMDFKQPKLKFSDNEFAALSAEIREAYSDL